MKHAAEPTESQPDPLQESDARLRAVLNTAVDGIITIESDGSIESFNPAAERIFGYSAEEVIGRNVAMLMPPPHREQHGKYIDNYLRTGDTKIIGRGREVNGRRKGGALFPMELAISEVQLADRVMFTGIVRDISARRRAELEARRNLNEHAHASRLAALGEMVSGIAHELNQPLAAIVSFADACQRLLGSGQRDPTLLQDALQQISEQGRRAGSIVNQLKDFVKKREATRSIIDINDIVRNVLDILRYEIRNYDVKTNVDFASHLPMLRADRIQIEQVLLNLVQNAIDAMAGRETRVVSLYTQLNAEKVTVTVSDTGPGFGSDISEQMFDAFFTTKPKGTGLGLSISRSIIEAHGGALMARQQTEGGAVFEFTLPLGAGDDGG